MDAATVVYFIAYYIRLTGGNILSAVVKFLGEQ